MEFYVWFSESFQDQRVSRYIWVNTNAIPTFGRLCQNLMTSIRELFGLDGLEAHHKYRNVIIYTRTNNFGGSKDKQKNMMKTFAQAMKVMLYRRYVGMERDKADTLAKIKRLRDKYKKESYFMDCGNSAYVEIQEETKEQKMNDDGELDDDATTEEIQIEMDGISRNDIGDATGLLQVYKSESVNGIQDIFYMNHAFRNVIANQTKMNMTKQGISLLVAVKEGANNVKKLRLLFKYKYIKEYSLYSKNPR
eukprot:981534_1